MDTARIFANGRSQAVRLPKEYKFDTDEVYINKVGGVVMLYPCEAGWDALVESLDRFTDDFMLERDQPEAAERRDAL